jgi:hypothetical protein
MLCLHRRDAQPAQCFAVAFHHIAAIDDAHRQPRPRWRGILLYDLDKIGADCRDDGDMAEAGRARKDDQVALARRLRTTLAVLQHAAPLIEGALGCFIVEEADGIAHAVGHDVPLDPVEVAFDELHALPLLPEIGAVGRKALAVGGREDRAIVIDGHAVEALDHGAPGPGAARPIITAQEEKGCRATQNHDQSAEKQPFAHA